MKRKYDIRKRTLVAGILILGIAAFTVTGTGCNKSADDIEGERETTELSDSTSGVMLETEEATEYSGDIQPEISLEETLQNMRPAIVHLYCEMEDGSSTTGSGFLVEITEEYIYICTNRHVINEDKEWKVFFYDGTMVDGENIGTSEAYDVGVVTVPLASVPDELLDDLVAVQIDLNYWEELKEDDAKIGLLRIGQNGEVLHILTGELVKKETIFLWGNGEMETEIKLAQTSGDSGSAIFDQYGKLISMVYGTSSDVSGERNWGIPLDAIVSCYEEITGRVLDVY